MRMAMLMILCLTKSQVMCYDIKICQVVSIMLVDTVLSVAQTYRYLGHTNSLSEEADMEDKTRGLYASRSNRLCFAGSLISDQVKNKLWVSYRKRCMRQFILSYNDSFRILRRLPMKCSASAMFASSNVDSWQARIRRSIYSLRCRLDVSFNLITHSIINSDVHVTSKLYSICIATLYNLAALR